MAQFVLQLRVNPAAIKVIRKKRLGANDKYKIDPSFANNEIEWLVGNTSDYWDLTVQKRLLYLLTVYRQFLVVDFEFEINFWISYNPDEIFDK